MNDQPDLSTLPQWMRYAADVIEEVRARRTLQRGKPEWPVSDFVPGDLRKIASEWEAAAKQTELLIQDCRANDDADRWGEFARKLIESGWRKADPA